MNCLVTGGAGFIGSNLVNRLVSLGHSVEVVDDFSYGHLEFLDQNKFRVAPADLLPSFLEAKPDLSEIEVLVIEGDFSHENVLSRVASGVYDVVFHQAAIPRVLFSVENPSETTYTNIGKTVSLLEACINSVDRVVFASSSSVYGGPDEMPIKEDTPKNPRSPYAWQKSAIEDCAKVFKIIPVCILIVLLNQLRILQDVLIYPGHTRERKHKSLQYQASPTYHLYLVFV